MALFINDEQHPDVFKSNEIIYAPNQRLFQRDYLSELMEEQQKANDLLQYSLRKLENSFVQQEQALTHQSKKIGNQSYKIDELNFQHEEFENQIVNWMKKLEAENRNQQVVLADSLLVEREFTDKINAVSQSNQEIVNELGKHGLIHETLSLKMDEQSSLQKKIFIQLSQQDNNQNEMIKRLESQEALTEKMLRQIDHFRSILFERTHYLAEKIENGYNVTSSYIYKLMKSSELPVAHFKIQKKEEKDG